VASIGLAPSISVGGEAGVGLRRGPFSIEGLIRAETTVAPARQATGDRVGATVFAGALVPCGEVAGARLCGVPRVGALDGSDPDLPADRLNNGSIYVSLGPRVGYAFHLWSGVTLEPSIGVDFALVRTKLIVDSSVAWTQPVVAGSAALSMGVAF
jgi:hypothetical protein